MWEYPTFLHANTKGADQPAHLCSLVCDFVVRYLANIMAKLDTCTILIFSLVSVAGLAGLSNPEDRFSFVEDHIILYKKRKTVYLQTLIYFY